MKVLVVCGSSGGHIFPALGFLERLKEKVPEVDILLVLPKRNFFLSKRDLEYKVKYLSISAVKPGFNFTFFFSLVNFSKGTLESAAILSRFNPDIVVGFGSLVSLPVVILAWLFRIQTLIHEQNLVFGRANKFMARFADRIAISFRETKDYFKNFRKKIVTTGNPLRKEIFRVDKDEALDFFGLAQDKFTILVMGGSQGSQRINFSFLKALEGLAKKSQVQVIHLAGSRDYDAVDKQYQGLGISLRLYGFFDQMHYAYSAASLVISRAGATTISEIIFFKLPAILIPYPYAYKHQLGNAKVLEKQGAALIIEESQLEHDRLREALGYLVNNPDRLSAMQSCYDSFKLLDANDLLAREVIRLAKYHGN